MFGCGWHRRQAVGLDGLSGLWLVLASRSLALSLSGRVSLSGLVSGCPPAVGRRWGCVAARLLADLVLGRRVGWVCGLCRLCGILCIIRWDLSVFLYLLKINLYTG